MLRKNLVILPHHASALDLDAIHAWGEPVTLERKSIYADETERFDRIAASVPDFLTNCKYDPDEDFVLLGGDRAIVGIVMAEIAAKFGRMRMLKWDNHNHSYYEVWWRVKQS